MWAYFCAYVFVHAWGGWLTTQISWCDYCHSACVVLPPVTTIVCASFVFFPHLAVGTEGSLYLLATCYYRAGQTSRTYSVLKGQTNVDCRYLFARTCLDLKK